jgi:hypothetical protein
MVLARTPLVISAADDYPLHQSSRPFRDPGVDRNLYDRFFFCGYPTDPEHFGSTYFAVAFGTYPGRNIVDAAFSVIVDGVQHNVRGSRLMGADRLDLRCGPVSVEIVAPLRTLRVRVDAPEAGITAELTFSSRGPAFEEPHYRWAPGNLTVFDITRMTQNGTWSGWITTPTRRLEVTNHDWVGTRDRSWGIRGVGKRDPDTAPDGVAGFYWLWAPMNFPDQNVIFDVNETTEGVRWHANATVAAVGSDARSLATESGAHTYAIDWKPGTRHARAFTTTFALSDRSYTYEFESRLTFYMMGIGYTHPTWGHGMWVGPDERSHDSFVTDDVDETDPGFQHVQILSSITRSDGAKGAGILEMLLLGPHRPSGLTAALDMHP